LAERDHGQIDVISLHLLRETEENYEALPSGWMTSLTVSNPSPANYRTTILTLRILM